MAVASIAHWDWPAEWPGLLEVSILFIAFCLIIIHLQHLVPCLHADDATLRRGALRCVEMFASGENVDVRCSLPL